MPKKGENIYKRKDGRWEGRYIKSRTESGKIIYGYVYARSYRETKEKQKAKIASYTSQILSNKMSMYFQTLRQSGLKVSNCIQKHLHRINIIICSRIIYFQNMVINHLMQ